MKIHLLLIAIAIAIVSNTNAQDKTPYWQFGSYGVNIAENMISVIDINNDNLNELFLTTSIQAGSEDIHEHYFYILEYSDLKKNYQFSWISRVFSSQIIKASFYDLNNDQVLDIIIGLENGILYFFDGYSHKELKSFSTGSGLITDMEVIDINNDKTDEIVICKNNKVLIFNPYLEKMLEITEGAYKFQIGNIDNDESVEIVLSTGKIFEVKNNTYNLQGTFQSNNNTSTFKLFDYNNDNKLELIYKTNDSKLTAYDFNTQIVTWSINLSSLTSLYIYKNTESSYGELYIGTSYDGINIYNASTGSFVSKLPEHFEGVNNITIGDVDNDMEKELVWTDGSFGLGIDNYIYINNMEDHQLEWQSSHLDGPFTAIDYGDVDNDGENEIVIASEASKDYYHGGVVSIFDVNTCFLEFQSNSFSERITSIKISDIDNDGINELLMGVESRGYITHTTYLYVYDAVKHQIDKKIEVTGSRRIREIKVDDINLDGINEIIFSTGSKWSDDESHVYILSGKTQEILWQSEDLGGHWNYVYSLNIANIDEDDALEIIGIDYNNWDARGDIIIIDGKEYSLTRKSQYSYSSLAVGDYDNNGKSDIIAGTDDGKIAILSGSNLELYKTINADKFKINAIKMFGLDENATPNILYSNGIQLTLINNNGTNKIWESDTIQSGIGNDNCLIAYKNNNGILNALIGSNHCVYEFNDFTSGTTDIADKIKTKTDKTYIYSNPTDNNTTIFFQSNTEEKTEVEIYDFTGKLVHTFSFKAIKGGNLIPVSLEALQSGIYIYKINQKGMLIASIKFIKL